MSGFASADAVHAAFYAAFEARRLDAMMACWDASDEVVCIHPMTVPLTGHAAVRAGWQSIFEAAGKFRIQTELLAQQQLGDVVLQCVKEYLTIGDEPLPRPPILATNLYRRDAAGWRLWLHHGSPVEVGDSTPQVMH